tara:strand:+ start:114539 stop:115321 length:783 start_codon:yes stop_codon:yes gene_type:complete
MSKLKLGEIELNSRLILGTGKFESFELMRESFDVSGTQMITVAIRRVDLNDTSGKSLLDFIDRDRYELLPNTAGCYTAKDAILTCELAREALGTDTVKLEVIGDEKTLFPDNEATLEAARILVGKGFKVMPYTLDDPIACKKLEEIGCIAVMPLAAPIGSGLGIRNPHNIAIIVENSNVPIIVDAGVGTASDASFAMEIGCDGILMNTGVAGAQNPVKMAKAMKKAVAAGRLAFEAGRIPIKSYGSASSPLSGMINFPNS